MRRRNHKVQGALFVLGCVLMGLLIYSLATRATNPDGAATTAATTANQADLSGRAPIIATVAPPEPSQDTSSSDIGEDTPASEDNGDCHATVLRRVSAVGGGDSVLEPGDTYDTVTQYWRNMRTGATWFCAHGSYCYPATVEENGRSLPALQLDNCAIGDPEPNPFDNDPEEIMYPVR